MNGPTTIQVGADTRDRLGRLQLDLRRDRGGQGVTTDQAVQFLLNALEELPPATYQQLVRAQFGAPPGKDPAPS